MSKRTRMVLAVGLVVAAPAAAGAGPGGFTFTPPPGWVDISRGAPEANRQKAPAALLAQADSATFAYFAADLDHADDGFIENMNAIVDTGKRPPVVTAASLDEMVSALRAEMVKQGMSYRSLKREVVKLGGVTVGRLLGETTAPNGLQIQVLQYAIPGEMSHASLTFTTTPENFARYEPLFDAAAQATRGAVEPRPGRSIADSALRGGIVGGIAGGIGALLAGLLAKRRRKAAAAAAAQK